MKYRDAVSEYINDQRIKHYTKDTVRLKNSILTNWFSYALSLFHPDAVTEIKKIKKPVFFNNQRLYTCTQKKRIEAVKQFLQRLNQDKNVIFLNLDSFLKEYQDLSDFKRKALIYFLRAAGFSLNIEKINRKLFDECIDLFGSLKKARSVSVVTDFLIFCYEKKYIDFNPYPEAEKKYCRCYEDSFIGNYEGIYRDYLKKYIDYMRYERNFADGGNDYRIRKLRVFTRYMDEKGIKEPDLQCIKDFLAMKEKDNVQKKTLSFYLFEITQFFDYLYSRQYIKSNPAKDLKIKYLEEYQKEVLTDKEVYQVLEYFDTEIYRHQNPDNIQSMHCYFRLVRDNLIFQIFILLGLRLSELAFIKLEDMDLSKRCIQITGKGNRTVKKKITEVKLDPYLWTSLKAYLKIRKYSQHPFLFLTWSGKNLSTQRINALIHRRMKEAGITKRISPHRLRATCASLYVKKGVDPLTLKNIMRHNSISTTMNYYASLTEDELRKVWKDTNPLKGVLDED